VFFRLLILSRNLIVPLYSGPATGIRNELT
jgi:hypothetical protein